MLHPNCNSTFHDYRHKVFFPFVFSIMRKVKRTDIVFDVYSQHSLKLLTREERGAENRLHITANTKIPANWQKMLRVDENKTELFQFLADTDLSCLIIPEKIVVMTSRDTVKASNSTLDVSGIEKCSHEEADTRIILHCLHHQCRLLNSVAVRTVDTDIVVLAASFFSSLVVRVSQKKTTFEMCGSHPLKGFLLLSYYIRNFF